MSLRYIKIKGARQNNLKGFDLQIPLQKFTVVCGLSGSGKSSLAFETLFAEGQRNYTQTLSNYSRQYINEMAKPLIESIENIPPALALQQKNTVRSARPTVATLTELDHLFRLLFMHSGQAFCPEHNTPLRSFSPHQGAQEIQKLFPKGKGIVSFPIKLHRTGLNWPGLKKKLLKEGLTRVWQKQDNTRAGLPLLKEINQINQSAKEFYVVVDRLMFKDRARLTDSLKSAYKLFLRYNKTEKAGEALISPHKATTEKKLNPKHEIFFLSESPSCPHCAYRFPFYPFPLSLFNFNSSLGACPTCKGFGHQLAVDEKKVVPYPEKSIMEGAIMPWTTPSTSSEFRSLKQFCRKKNIDLHCPWNNLSTAHKKKIWKGDASFMGMEGFFDYLERKKYKMHVRVFLNRYKSAFSCPDCKGQRFRKELAFVRWQNKTIMEFYDTHIGALKEFFLSCTQNEHPQAFSLIRKISFILKVLDNIGLSYLSLGRSVKTLSSGEFQRLNLAHQMGLELSQVLYVLDEPTVGLHAQDSQNLIRMLKDLCDKGNTMLVVEHDPDLIRQADFIVEMGPGSGFKGGEVVFQGTKEDFLKCSHSLTKAGLEKQKESKPLILPVDFENHKYFLEISGCQAHNLKNVSLRVPLNRLVTVTGVSGSGKSTLISQTLYPALANILGYGGIKGHPFKTLKGAEQVQKVVWINPAPVKNQKNSLVATYAGVYGFIRHVMALNCHQMGREEIPSRLFSLNVEGGRCPSCRGLGYQEIDMVFMDPIRTPCEECQGKRFKQEVLDLKWKNKNMDQILNMTVDTASEFFVSSPYIWKPLSFLKKVGLNYLLLGQTLRTLSGGESQRLKLSRELMGQPKNTLYIMDEPTVGLHFREVELLLSVLRELIRQGGSVLLIEHHLDLIQQSDFIIDMGPGAGPEGGKIIAKGTPYELAENPLSVTGAFLNRNQNNSRTDL